jgi:hypothetical protein
MKKLALVITVVILAVAASTAIAALPGTGWTTNVQVQNVGTADAHLGLTVYSGSVSTPTSSLPTIPVGGSATILASQMGINNGFQGAGVLSSDQPLFGILFVTNYGTGANNTATAIVSAVGADYTGNPLNFPLAKKNYGGGKKTTTFYIQNAGSDTATITATMTTLAGSCAGPNPKVYSGILSNRQVNFTPQDMGCVDGTYGSMNVVSNNQPLAGVVLEHDDSLASPAGGTRVLQGTRGFGPADGDTLLVAPIIKKGWGANKNVTGMQVQNVSPGNATIPAGGLVVTYTIAGSTVPAISVGAQFTETNASPIEYGKSFNTVHQVLPASTGLVASAVVAVKNSNQRIVGIVNENRPLGTTVFRNTTYSLIPNHDAGTSISLPLVKEFYGGQGGRCTGVQVVPIGGNAQMRLVYQASGGQTYTVTTSSAVGTTTFVYVSNGVASASITGGAFSDMRSKNFGVTATSLTSGVKLVAVANESFCPGSTRDEDDANYEGFKMP